MHVRPDARHAFGQVPAGTSIPPRKILRWQEMDFRRDLRGSLLNLKDERCRVLQ